MDKQEFHRFERHLAYFHPVNVAELASNLEIRIKRILESAFEQCHDKFHAISVEQNCDEEELAVLHNNINLIQTQCTSHFNQAITNIQNTLEEIIQVPDNINLDEDDNIDQIMNEYQSLKQEVFEQRVFMESLKQELSEYEKLEPVLEETEKLIERARNVAEKEVPVEIKQQLVSVINLDNDFVYKIPNI